MDHDNERIVRRTCGWLLAWFMLLTFRSRVDLPGYFHDAMAFWEIFSPCSWLNDMNTIEIQVCKLSNCTFTPDCPSTPQYPI